MTQPDDFRKATMSSFNAMRADLTDLRQDMTDLRSRVDSIEAKVDTGFTEMRGRLDATAAGMQHIADLLNTLIAQG
jgi:hypothetical protein